MSYRWAQTEAESTHTRRKYTRIAMFYLVYSRQRFISTVQNKSPSESPNKNKRKNKKEQHQINNDNSNKRRT